MKKSITSNNTRYRIRHLLIIIFTMITLNGSNGQQYINAVSRAERYIECSKKSFKRIIFPKEEIGVSYLEAGNLTSIKGILTSIDDSSFVIEYRMMQYVGTPGGKRVWTGKYSSDFIRISIYTIFSITRNGSDGTADITDGWTFRIGQK